MFILGVETSCDETAAAVVQDGKQVLSSIVASSFPSHSQTGGIIPEVAAREQSRSIIPVVQAALEEAKKQSAKFQGNGSLDSLAITFGPGLIGPLLVGVETVKTLSYAWKKPVVPINHLIGHLYSAWLENQKPPHFPLIALIVSGGHTELLYVQGHGDYEYLGGTRDDAAGEAFDKIARALGLGYPGGPAIEKAANRGDSSKFHLPRPLKDSRDFDFSFSGLKTAAVNQLAKVSEEIKEAESFVPDMAASVQEAIVDILVYKTLKATEQFHTNCIVIGGGVAANKRLRKKMKETFNGDVQMCSPNFAVDNGAMIAAAAFFNHKPLSWSEFKANPSILF